jgi:hypothetical protein
VNINSWLARGVASVAVISFAFGASACDAEQPSSTTPSSANSLPGDNFTAPSQPDAWSKLATSTPADMHELDGATFGLSWKKPSPAGQGQGFIGVAKLGSQCVVIVSPGILAQPDKFTVEIEQRHTNQLVFDDTNQTVDGIQQAINNSRASCG